MKRFKLLVATLLLPVLAMAQPGVGAVSKALPVKVDLGIKVGANFANLDGKEWESGYKPGFVGGIFGGVSRKRLGVTAEVLFSSVKYTGNKINFYQAAKTNYVNIADSNKQGEFAVTYLNIPVLLNFKIGGPLWLQLGPQYSGVMNVKDNQNLLKDTKTLFKTGDLSGVVGLQLNLAKFRASARYIIGLSDLSYNTATDTWKTRTVQIALGYSFL